MNNLVKQVQFLEHEQNLMDAGISSDIIFCDAPITNQIITKQIRPVVVPLVATAANRFIEQLHVNEVYGVFVNVDYSLLAHVDPRVIVPLFPLQTQNEFGELLHMLSEFNPRWTTGSQFFNGLNDCFIAVANEVKYRVRSNHFDYFWSRMSRIIYEPLTWYGKTKFANNANNNPIQIRQDIPVRSAILKQIRENVENGSIHYTAYNTAWFEEMNK